jgi:lipopolysaccharide/colanic/teichoic acid biosynthesis glycosyltransferase
MAKRVFDLVASCIGLLLLLPVLLGLALWVMLDSRGGIFYRQVRVGKGGVDFKLWKFRTMHPDADKRGLLTVGGRDPRITRAGYYLRKYKLDELPQLLNVLTGDMSLVGPRPEVRKYVSMYTPQQMRVLDLRPGITDYASIEYSNENELLAQSADPERTYIEEVMPAKLALNEKYIAEQGLITDLRIIWMTVRKIVS